MMSEQEWLAKAQTGDVEAIAFLLNLTLNKKNQQVEVRAKPKQLEFSIEASVLPPQSATTRWIAQALCQLSIPDLETAVVYGKLTQHIEQTDSETHRWQQTVRFFPGSSQIDPFSSSIALTPSEPPLNLTEWCFIRNKFLLKSTLSVPPTKAIQLVLSFAALPNTHKLEGLPHVHNVLFQINDSVEATLSADAQSWLAQLTALDSVELGQALTWLSRYCADPALTINQLRQTASMVSPELLPNPNLTPQRLAKPALTEAQALAQVEIAGKSGWSLQGWVVGGLAVVAFALGITLSMLKGSSFHYSRAHVRDRCVAASGAEVCDEFYSTESYPVVFIGGAALMFCLFSWAAPD